MLYNFHVFLELLPAPQNCLVPIEQGLTFKRLFMMVVVLLSCISGLFNFSQNLVSWKSEKIFYLICSPHLAGAWLGLLALWRLICRRPYSPRKIVLDPSLGKRKGKVHNVGRDLLIYVCCVLT